jgi:hypothetical protein
VRQFHVDLIKRQWSGTRRGDGTASVLSTVRLDPRPLVTDTANKVLQQYGLDEEGQIMLKEVSLTYTEQDLTGGTLADNQEFYYRLTDANGQGIAPRYFIPDKQVRPDRDKDIGWIVRLRRAEVEE